MCMPGNDAPVDNSAAIARQQADEREAKITTGKGEIDKAFGVFDPGFYDKFTKAYTDNYNPEVDRQFGDAKQQVHYDTARKGTTNATPGQKQFGDLTREYGVQRQDVASKAIDATNKLRGNVDAQKTNLYAQNSSSADPSLSAISAVSSANSLGTPAQFSPMGNLFAGAINGTAGYLNGRNNRMPAGYENAFAPGATLPGGSGSGRVVR